MKRFYIATDHAGFAIKEFVKEVVANLGCEVIDLGPENDDRVDYPDFARKCRITSYNVCYTKLLRYCWATDTQVQVRSVYWSCWE